MINPNIGFTMVKVILCFHDLDYALRCSLPDKALAAISSMMNSLRNLRRAIRLDKNIIALIDGKEENLEIKSH